MLRLHDSKLELLWESKVMRNQMSGCVLWEEHLYGFDETTLKCLNLDGEELWRKRGLGKGCLQLADGKILAMSADGELVIAAAKPDGYEELSRKKVLDGGVYWTTPVLVGGLIYCRNSDGDLVCLDHRPQDG
jgi:outer membrane protein assembly factor BamB